MICVVKEAVVYGTGILEFTLALAVLFPIGSFWIFDMVKFATFPLDKLLAISNW